MATPTYVYQHTSGYIFRYCVPQNVQHVLGQREFRYSLRTGSLRTAKIIANHLALKLKTFVVEIQNGIKHDLKLIKQSIRYVLNQHIVQQSSTLYYSDQLPSPSAQSLPFSELVQKYIDEKLTWTEKTRQENIAIYSMFQRIAGDLPLSEITRQMVSEYKRTMLSLPPGINKHPKYKKMSIAQILKSNPTRKTSPSTVNKHLVRLSSLFKFAMQNGFCDQNPATDMQIRISKRDDELRAAYSKDDLDKLFKSEEYLQGIHKHSYQFWMPILGLFTGARLEELAQLHLDDIRQVDGVWVLDINDKGDKRLKTKSSKRLIPIHPFVRDDLGLIRHSQQLRENGFKRLFPELSRKRDGYGQTVSRWFNARYKVKCGITPHSNGAKLDFHSFRHTFVDALKQLQVNPNLIRELDGHKNGDMTMDRYGKAFSPRTLLHDAVERLNFNLAHLIKNKFNI